jgi:hypothetical protein
MTRYRWTIEGAPKPLTGECDALILTAMTIGVAPDGGNLMEVIGASSRGRTMTPMEMFGAWLAIARMLRDTLPPDSTELGVIEFLLKWTDKWTEREPGPDAQGDS